MKNVSQILKTIIVAVFIAAIGNVYLAQYLCNQAHAMDLTGQEHSHELGHDHHHSDGNTSGAGHSHEGNPVDEGSEDDNCCEDKTIAFFASLTNPATFHLNIKAGLTAIATDIFTLVLPYSNEVNSTPYLSYKSPPPKIPDIRVFIQSFLI